MLSHAVPGAIMFRQNFSRALLPKELRMSMSSNYVITASCYIQYSTIRHATTYYTTSAQLRVQYSTCFDSFQAIGSRFLSISALQGVSWTCFDSLLHSTCSSVRNVDVLVFALNTSMRCEVMFGNKHRSFSKHQQTCT